MKYVVVGLALCVGLSGAAHSQGSVTAAPDRSVHPGTAILDSMGIVAGRDQSNASVSPRAPAHPGTALLDSLGIVAGAPASVATNPSTGVAGTVASSSATNVAARPR